LTHNGLRAALVDALAEFERTNPSCVSPPRLSGDALSIHSCGPEGRTRQIIENVRLGGKFFIVGICQRRNHRSGKFQKTRPLRTRPLPGVLCDSPRYATISCSERKGCRENLCRTRHRLHFDSLYFFVAGGRRSCGVTRQNDCGLDASLVIETRKISDFMNKSSGF
jgi:hypothetical protein